MKVLKLRSEKPSPKKILIIVGLGLVLLYCAWPTANDADIAPIDADTDLVASSGSLPASPQIGNEGSAKPVLSLPTIDVSFLINSNPFLSSETRSEQLKAEFVDKQSSPDTSSTPDIAQRKAAQSVLQEVVSVEEPMIVETLEHIDKLQDEVVEQEVAQPIHERPRVTIQAIVTGQKKPAVLINDRVYFENDRLSATWKIQSIFPDRVLFAPILNQAQ